MRLPLYALVGLGVLALSEAGMLAHIEPFWSWHTPILGTARPISLVIAVAENSKTGD
jgi:hypothetical protein